MLDWYRSVMDSKRNPLSNLPPAQRFQTMTVLSLMWTAIFCACAGAWFWYGEIVAVHIMLALGTPITGYTFHSASKAGANRDSPSPPESWR
jgi:hypothetical protein